MKGYRTLLVNGIAFVLAVAVALGWITVDQAAAVDPALVADQADAVAAGVSNLNDQAKVGAGIAAALALVNLVLRVFTTTPAGKKS